MSDLVTILKTQVPTYEEFGAGYTYEPKIAFVPLSMEGLADMHEYSSVPEFFQFIDFEPSKTVDETRQYLEKLLGRMATGFEDGHAMYWFLKLRETGKIIGTFGLVGVDFDKGIAASAKGLSYAHIGKGYMFEAQWVALKYAFEKLGLHTVTAFTRAENQPNVLMMKMAGYEITRRGPVEGFNHEMLNLKVTRDTVTFDKCLSFAKIAQRQKSA